MRKRRKDYQNETKTCEHCGSSFSRREGWQAPTWRKTRFCSIGCAKRGTYIDRTKERFDDNYIPEPMSGCWIWIGPVRSYGYGHMRTAGKAWLAHRLSFVLHKGPIPENLGVLHHCDNRLCVNPDHIYAGDNIQNIKDMVDRKRHRVGERNSASRLSREVVIEIRSSLQSDMELARKFGVSRTAVRNARHGSTWRHV